MRGHYIFKIPDTEVTMVAAGFADGTHFSNFFWQNHYTQGRQLMTTDQIQQICLPPIWQAISEGIFPSLDRLKAHLDSIQTRRLTQAEQELLAQVNLHWFRREVILQDSCFLYPLHPNSRLWRDMELFNDPHSPFMIWLKVTLTPAVKELQQKADRVHDSIIRAPKGQSILDQARTILGIKQATTVAHSRQLLDKMIELLDAKQEGKPQPQPWPQQQQPLVTEKARCMPSIPKGVLVKGAGLMPLWLWWARCMRHCYNLDSDLPTGSALEQPPKNKWEWLGKRERDDMNEYLQMLLELDRQIEAAWKTGRLKDDDRKLAAAKVTAAWEAKMRSYSNGEPNPGLSVHQVGVAFARTNTVPNKKSGPQTVILRIRLITQAGNTAYNVSSTIQAFLDYFRA